MAIAGKLFLALGGALFALAVGWWYAFFSQFLGEHVKEASRCFYHMDDGWCRANEALGFVGSVPVYSPVAFWAAVASALFGVFLLGLAPPARS